MSLAAPSSSPPLRVPFWLQCLAWALGLIACIAAMINLIAEWTTDLATVQFLFLVAAPVVWMIQRRRKSPELTEQPQSASDWRALFLAWLVGLTSWTTCYLVGRDMMDMPPAYHDEYSYIFQAKTLFLGTFYAPSHPSHPELFDQMHVLNEGRMASRYYPGTGLWLAPFVILHHPYWGQWLASSLASVFVFWTGYELGRLRIAIFSGFACALSPGIALFANLLLAHQATLMGLTFFVWKFVKWQRTRSARDVFFAGCGLGFAMLCRPATAAGVGLPFGIAFLHWLAFARENGRPLDWFRRVTSLIAIGIPLVAGWVVMLAYNQQVTGSLTTSPYQLYTDIYSPRHVYGFNNVVRGERKAGPKVIAAYDRWAKNLTPELAAENLVNRWFVSWLWTFDFLPLLLTTAIVFGTIPRADRRWLAIGFAILSLHAVHIPYWYVGIMGWHYVFETAPLWCLLLGLVTDVLFRDWHASGRWLMPGWWTSLLVVSLVGVYFPLGSLIHDSSENARISNGISSIRHPRRQYAEFNKWLYAHVTDHPAIVLMDIDPDDQHVDYVTNSPGLTDSVLRARFRRGITDVKEIARAFPHRFVYVCQPDRRIIQLFESSDPGN